MTNCWMKMHLEMTFYHKLANAKIFFTDEKKIETQSTKFKVTPDKTVSSWSHMAGFLYSPIVT